jgi:hypothetical protein
MDRTQEFPTEPVKLPRQQGKPGYQPGVAPIPPRRSEPTLSMEPSLPPGKIVTSGQLKQPAMPLRDRMRLLRSGGGWTAAGSIVLLICWALWAVSSSGGLDASGPILLIVLLVAAGVFVLCRLVGGIVLERMLSRTRRSAVLSHMTIGLFLAVVGFKLLSEVDWVISAWNFVSGNR